MSIRNFLQVIGKDIKKTLAEVDFSAPVRFKKLEEREFKISLGTNKSIYTWGTFFFISLSLSFILYSFSANYRRLIPSVLGVAETSFELPSQRAFDTGYDDVNSTDVLVASDSVQLSAIDGWWDASFVARKQITLKNLSPETLDATSSLQFTINTKELFDNGRLQADCDDLRVAYDNAGTHSEISRSFHIANGATNCSDSTATIITVENQANILTTASDANYYIYYGNDAASAPSSQDDGYNIGSANALLVCPFNGTTTCIDGETPSTETGAIRYQTGSAMEFDGVDDVVEVADNDTLDMGTDDFTISAWIKTSHNNDQIIVWKGAYSNDSAGYMFRVYAGKLRTDLGDGVQNESAFGTISVITGEWVHVAMVTNRATNEVVFYVNGSAETKSLSKPISGSIDNGYNIGIGRYHSQLGAYYPMQGKIDEVMITRRALTENEILAHYNNGSPAPIVADSSTKLLLHFDENGDDPRPSTGSGTGTVIDASGNGNDGTINGAHYTTGSPVPNQSYASHEGIFIEEGTTNLVDNPSFENNITDLWSGKSDVAAFTNGATDADGNTFLGDNNINDVFYYDTTTDSDGGAWRNDATAQASSWYSEAFSATRGHKNEFPEKAWIIATDSTVEIIDAVENKLWMRFVNNNESATANLAPNDITSIHALNGNLYVGGNGTNNRALKEIDFIRDDGTMWNSDHRYDFNGNIEGRNDSLGFTTLGDGIGIVNNMVNDVHAAVINGKTYVAVATDGGVSVINETDGTVNDYYYDGSTYTTSHNIFLDTDGTMYQSVAYSQGDPYDYQLRVSYSIQNDVGDQTMGNCYDANYSRTSPPGFIDGYIYDIYISENTSTIDGTSNTIYLATSGRLAAIQEKQGDESNGSVKYYTKDEITEEMVGDIRGAWGFNTNSTLSNGNDIQDVSVRDADMTAVADAGGIGVVDGVRGKAFQFDGTNDYLTQKVYEDETGSTWGPETHNISLADGAAMARAGETLGSELLTDGDMEAADTAAWTAAESTLSKETINPHGGSRSLRIVDNGNGLAIQSISSTAGKWYRITGWGRSDGTAKPQVRNASGVNIWLGTTSTDWQRFDVVFAYSGNIQLRSTVDSNYVEFDDISVKEVTSPDLSDYATAANDYMLVMKDGEGDVAWGYIDEATTGETLGSELVTNGDMESGGTGDPWIPTGWTNYSSESGEVVEETTDVHSGSVAVKLISDETEGIRYGISSLTTGKLYKLTFWAKVISGTGWDCYIDINCPNCHVSVSDTSWIQYTIYFTAQNTVHAIYPRHYSGTSGSAIFDDISLKEVTSLPSDGVKIMSTKAGATQSWAGISPDFDYNDSSYTFEVRKTDFQITGDLTVGAWVKPNVVDGSYKTIISKAITNGVTPAFDIKIINTVGYIAYVGGGVAMYAGTPTVGKWDHIMLVTDGVTEKIYINGVEANSKSNDGPLPNDNYYPLTIGNNASHNGYRWNGTIDEPFITAEALTADQIKNMFDTGCRAMGGTPGVGTCTGIDESSTTNKLAGDSNVINAVWASPTGSEIYVGSDGSSGAISVLQGNADVLTTSFTTGTSPALVNNDTTSIAVAGSSTSVPTMIVGSETAGVSVLNSDRVSETQSIVNKKFGNNSLMLGNSNSVFDSVYSFTDTLTATDYAFSFYTYTNGNQSTSADIVPLIDSQPVADATYEDVGGGWTRVSKSFTGTTEADKNFGVQVKAGKTAYVDGVQLENKAYETTYCDGSLGTGYSWSGTENNSNSVRTSTILKYPISENVLANSGTISLWLYMKEGTGNQRRPFANATNSFMSQTNFSGNRIYTSTTDANGNNATYYDYSNMSEAWVHYVFTWNGSSCTSYGNGNAGTTDTSCGAIVNLGTDLELGSYSTGFQQIKGDISDLRIYDQPLSADEVSDLYNQGLAAHSNGSEVGKYDGISDATYYSGRIDMNAVSSWSETDDIAVASTLNGGTADIYTCTKNLVTGTCTEEEYVPLVGNEIQSDPARYMFVKTVLNPADTFTTPVLNGLTFNYLPDNTPPTNPTEIHTYSTNTKETEYQGDDYGNSDRPYFEWPKAEEAGGASDTGEGSSGVNGYYVYFGTDDTAVPETAGTYITEVESGNNHYQLSVENALTEKGNYYLRIQPMDKAGSIQPTVWAAFTYQYDNEEPDNPSSVSVTPAGWNKVNSYEFYWPTGADGDSQLWGYCYKTGDPEVEEICIEDNSVTDVQAYQSGENIFYIRSIDNAGNKNSNYIQTTYYYNADAPSAPNNLDVEPETNDTNEYTFTWDEPSEFNGEVKGYYYSINTEPTLDTAIFTTETQVGPGPYATRQGENKFYVVAEDTAGNKNFEIYAEVSFYANTTAPGIPTGLSISDSSDRANSRFSLTLEWNESEDTVIDKFNIYRSHDGTTFEKVAQVDSTIYSETGLDTDITYSYYITAEDDAGAESGNSQTVSKRPSGKFLTPPEITENPTVDAGRTSATITWKTDRESNSFVQIGPSEVYSRTQGQWVPTIQHSVEVKGLNPSTEYHFRVQSIDNPELIDYETEESFSQDYTFTTGEIPKIKDLEVKDIRHTSIIVMWSTDVVSTSVVYITGGEDRTVEDMASGGTTQHTILIDNLNAGTQYTVRVSGTDEEGNTLIGEEHSFTTPAYPSVSEVRLEQQKEAAVGTLKASWQTNVPTTSVAKYNKKDSEDIVEVSSSELITEHELLLTGLADNSEYEIVVSGRDSFGNEARSDMQTFTTDVDTRPPKIESVIIETGIIGTGSKARAQLVISWDTDELSTSQVEFDIGAGDIEGEVMYSQKTKEDSALTTSHVVVISDLQPSQVYHLRIATKDGADNTSYSENNIAVTDEATENALELVMNSLLDTFGWLFGME